MVNREFPFEREDPLYLPSAYSELRRKEPISKVRISDGSIAWLITGYEDSKTALKGIPSSADTDLPTHPHQGPGTKVQRRRRSFMSMDAPEHAHYRQMITGEFSVPRVERLRPRIAEIVEDRLDALRATGPPADLVELFALPVPSMVISAMLGVPFEDHDFFQYNTRMILAAEATPDQGRIATDNLCDYIGGLLHHKARTPDDDLLSRLAGKVTEGAISQEDAVSTALILLIGGHETTSSQIALSALVLLTNPDQMDHVRTGVQGMEQAVEELLRYINVTQAGRRRVVLRDVEVGGVRLQAGDAIIVATDAASHDTTHFYRPEVLDIGRKNAAEHLAFGYGVHQCVGHRLARAELQVALGGLINDLPSLELAVAVDALEFRAPGAISYGVKALPVRW